MIPAPLPANEAERLEALRRYRLHITGREPEFERVAHQVSDLFGAPIALISLVLDDEQRFMGACGLDLPATPRDFAFCAHALAGEEVLVVPDARADPRFARNPLVTGPPHIRSYAGAPLLIEPGVVVGTLCAIGTEPRDFTAAERRRLAALAGTVVDLVRLRLGALTEREAEESRDAAARQLEEVLDAMPAALAVYDEGGLLLRTNRAFRETLLPGEAEAPRPGMTPAEVWRVMGSRGHRILQSGPQAEWLHGGPKGSRVPRETIEMRLADGRILHGSETRTPSGLLVSVKMDVTELKEREATITAQEALQRATLESIEHGVLVLDRDRRLALWNERFFEIMLLPERLRRVGTPLEALVRAWIAVGEEAPSGGNARDLSAEFQQEGNRRLELATPAGRVIDYRRSPMPDGRSIITVADITARREAERMKDEFVSTVSHELRTPLTAIAGSLGLLAAGAAGALTERGRHLLDIARKNSGRLTRLINDLLDIGKMEAGKLQLALRPVPLAEALRQAAEQNRPYAERLGVGISLDLPGEELVACADPDRLQQVLANFMSNAAKFSPRGGTVNVALASQAGGLARITVTDRGPGVPEAFRARLFEKFAQADATARREREGTGLGLAIARAIVERHGGAIGFTPGPGGVGSSFHVDLPLAIPAEGRPPSVLVYADDGAAERIEAALRRSGLALERCATAEAAITRLSAAAGLRAVLLDAAMLDRGGIALLEAVRSRQALREVHVLLLAVAADGTPKSEALDVVDWVNGPEAMHRMMPEALRAAAASAGLEAGAGRPCVLHVEDDPDLRELVVLSLGDAAEVAGAPDIATARRLLAERRGPFALVILDIRLPDGSGLDLLPLLGPPEEGPARVVIYSAYEPSAEVARGVVAVLAKARVSVSDLAESVLGLVRGGGEEAA